MLKNKTKIIGVIIGALFIALPVMGATVLFPYQGGTGLSSYTTGDIIYSSNGDVLTQLNVGSDTQVLTLSGGVPTWADSAGGGGSGFNHWFTNTLDQLTVTSTAVLFPGYASSTTALNTQGNGHFGGNVTIDGTATTTGLKVQTISFTPDVTQSITAATDTFIITNSSIRISSDADYVMTSTPTIPNGADGQQLYIYNTGSFTIEIQDEATLSGSNILLNGGSGVIQPGEMIVFMFNNSESAWLIVSHVNDVLGNVGFIGKVNEAGGISKCDIVYLNGVTGNFPQVSLADNTDFTKATPIGIAQETKTNNQQITITQVGTVNGCDTSGTTAADILYLGTAGSFTTTHPSGVDGVVRVGNVVKVNASTGSLTFLIDSLVAINDFDGVMRVQAVNQNAGTGAVASFTFVNNASHRGSISFSGSNNTFGENFSLFNEGYGSTLNIIDGNQPYRWFTDVTDAHALAGTEKMRLTASGFLGIGTTTPSYQLVIERSSGGQNLFLVATTTDQNIFVVNSSGNIGIGTNTPDATLAVEGTASTTVAIFTQGTLHVGGNSTMDGTLTVLGNINGGTLSGNNSGDVTLAGTPDYITISNQVITRNTIDIGDDTNLAGGTNITLSGDTLNVDDAFIINSGSDVMAGTLTADGLTLGANENITLGAQTLDHDGTNFVFNDSVNITGTASTTVALNTQGTLHVGGNATVDGTVTTIGDIVTNGSLTVSGVTGGSLKLSNGLTSAPVGSGVPQIYRTGTNGGSYPFNAFGHLVLQPRSDGGEDIVFMVSDTGASTDVAMIIADNGRVGIGDTSPLSLLTVGSGDLFQVDGSGNATTSNRFVVGTDGALGSQKGCMAIMSTSDSPAFTYIYYNGTTQIISASSCEDTGDNTTSTLKIGQ